jgi:hypothetical protein
MAGLFLGVVNRNVDKEKNLIGLIADCGKDRLEEENFQ